MNSIPAPNPLPLQMLHLASDHPAPNLWTPAFLQALRTFGSLETLSNTREWSDDAVLKACRDADVVFTGWGARPLPAAGALDPGRLKYICHLTGTLRAQIPVEWIRSAVPITNWGDAPAASVAEASLTLLLACLKNLGPQRETKRLGGWTDPAWLQTMGSLDGLRIGLYGFGFIARRFTEYLRPFGPRIMVHDPRVNDLPPDLLHAPDLATLMRENDAVSIHAPLNDATRNSIGARELALLRDHGIVINTARGAIFDEPALFRELLSGRLRAGLDVLATDESPPAADHPLRHCPNVILTAHTAGRGAWPERPDRLSALHRVALDNLARFRDGRTLRFVMDEPRYHLST